VPVVDITFPLMGYSLPVDHGYQLLAALSDLVQFVHGDPDIGIHPIQGRLIGDRRMALTHRSRLAIRGPNERLKRFICLSGKKLVIGGQPVRLGIPEFRLLRPARTLHSRMVVIKGYTEAEAFLDALQRQLDQQGIRGIPVLPKRSQDYPPVEGGTGSRSPIVRRTLEIQGRQIVGFAVRVKKLSNEDSLRLQVKGLGGKRHLGCGIFVPD